MFSSKIYQYNFPTTIRFGAGSSNELGDYLKRNNLKRPLVVTDPTVAQLGFFKKITEQLNGKGIAPIVFHNIHKNPDDPWANRPTHPA
ncbi:MAG: iron-containing alcohol dehydrogenase [Sphingobacteriaceae bacterium]|nr:MAG: iron-containing alcohol dehydrogenase [Sphingobacteriaceae bacterium]